LATITIRVPEEIKEKIDKYNINVSETVRTLLYGYLSELESKDLADRLELLRERLGNTVDPKLVAELVREDRERR
jgi:hypothetical protein